MEVITTPVELYSKSYNTRHKNLVVLFSLFFSPKTIFYAKRRVWEQENTFSYKKSSSHIYILKDEVLYQ